MSQLTQQIQYFDTPAPHLIIDNFLSNRLANEFLEEAVRLQPQYKPAEIGSSQAIDGCEECQRILKINQLIKRKNDVS